MVVLKQIFKIVIEPYSKQGLYEGHHGQEEEAALEAVEGRVASEEVELSGGEHHDAHDALGIDGLVVS
jgi:hypothetical protein